MQREQKCYRQGELLFIKLEGLTKEHKGQIKAKLHGDNVIREGEVTGHKHEVSETATLSDIENINGQYLYTEGSHYQLPAGEMFLTSENTIEVKHPEHRTLKLEKGDYMVRIQREYDETRDRYVND